MPEFIPFRGLCYNEKKVGGLADVLTPPYDVISAEQQEAFYAAHPNNIIRLILNKATPQDTDTYGRPQRSAAFFSAWREDGTLVQDAAPAYYLTAVDFSVNGKPVSRYGLIGLIGLEPFENGNILPHERTFSKVKTEQLKLLRATHGNFCPIFSVFSDGRGVIQDITLMVASHPPEAMFTDGQGLTHRMWRIIDNDAQAQIRRAFQETTVFIADGHHRYESALNYSREVAAATANMDAQHPANFVMMYLSSLEDPGLVILPAHRLLKDVPPQKMAAFIDKASAVFDVEGFSFQPGEAAAAQTAFIDCLERHSLNHAFGICISGDPTFYCLRLKPGVMGRLFNAELAPALIDLDVTIVTRLALMELLGYDQERLDDESRIDYASNASAAIDAWMHGGCDMAVILNPTRIEQVQAVAQQGLIMPRKSTYFYPKTISGQVLYHHG
ncbi:MAG: DUF1015 domain-containing protein [Pseudomonadota bacterium]